MTMNNKTTTIDKILFIGICISLASLFGATAWAQNITTSTNDQVVKQIADSTPLASDEQVQSNDATTKTLLGGTAATIGTAIVAEFVDRKRKETKAREKDQRIDLALRGTDYDMYDIQVRLRTFFAACRDPANKSKPVDDILALPANPEKYNAGGLSIGDSLDKEFADYIAWFEERYKDNPQ